ncbi:unnamed protein product [Clavelina lepadiformis]|uniref:Tetratricopeptide repeat protein 6 n=1 Tax=Clavelina lepadiformis TaxID=159417 RepID=A0ABP0FDU6_CLALP
MGSSNLQQWQVYNPLDKSNIIPDVPKSNKLPFSKDNSKVTTSDLLQPKISSVGVCPSRSSIKLDDLKVMMVGLSVADAGREKINETLNQEKDSLKPTLTEDMKENKTVALKQKMPAILNAEGTTMKAQFAIRAKPPTMPRSTIKTRRKLKKPLSPPPNSSSGKKSASSTTCTTDDEINVKSRTVSSAPRSSPTDQGTVMSVEITEPASTPVRSIDDMIQTLRSSRHASGSQKSTSDQKIDEILKQVMSHAQEWMNESLGKDHKDSSDQDDDPIQQAEKVSYEADNEENISPHDLDGKRHVTSVKSVTIEEKFIDVDVSDTVSTLASQISAPAGIPDVSTILLRKSSHGMRGTSSQFSALSSPVALMQDDDDMWNYEQAVRDLNMSLDVKNDDIISIQGSNPPLLEKPVAGFPQSKEISGAGDFSQPSFHSTGGKIHRLCLLPAIKELTVNPREFALSKVTHTSSDVDLTSLGNTATHVIPENLAMHKKNANLEEFKAETGSGNRDKLPKPKQENHLDSSKLDPLDIDGWRTLVEGEFEKVDYSLHGSKTHANEWGAWRMLWTVAPPKMSLSTSAVKALVFPHYHGTRISAPKRVKEESWLGEDTLSDIYLEDEDKNLTYERTLRRRHKSAENLPTLLKESTIPKRPNSGMNLAKFDEDEYSINCVVKTDYTSNTMEVQQQKESVFQQHSKERQSVVDEPEHELFEPIAKASSLTTYITASQGTLPLSAPNSSPPIISQPESQGLARQAKKAERSFVVYSRKKQRSRRSKKFVQNAKKRLTSYKPLSLRRSQSASSFFPTSCNELTEVPQKRPQSGKKKLHGKITRSTSIPDMSNFTWFISRHQKYYEKIKDMREWVRGIWNVWFDEVFPEESDEESSFYEKDEDVDDFDDEESKKREEEKMRTDHVAIPDVIPPALSSVPVDLEKPEEVLRGALADITKEISELPSHETSIRACHLSRRGALLRKLGEIKRANDDLDEAIALEPRLGQAYWQRHLIRLLRNQQHEALDDLNVLLKINKTNVDGYRSRADIFATLGDYTMAVVNYSQVIKLAPDNEEPYFQRASIFEKTGDMLLAMEDYGSVVRINPTRTDALLKRALFSFKKGSWHSAVTDFTQLIQKEPLNAQARMYRGRAYAEYGNHECALRDLSAAIHLDPLNPIAFYHRGALLRKVAPNKALQDLSTSFLLDNSEKNVLAVLHRGILYSELKKYQEAMADFEQTLRLDLSMACAHVNIGLIHLQVTGNYWEAVKRFTFAIKGDPTYTRSYVCRSDALARIHEYQAAVRDITRAIHLQPQERHLYLRRGRLLLQLKKLKLAAFCVRHIATLEKGFVSTSPTQEAVVQSFLGSHTAAVDSLSVACRTKPVPHMYVLLSKTLMKGKRYKEAITNLKNALELCTLYTYGDTNNSAHQAPAETAEMHFLLGQCHTEMFKHPEALMAYNQALKVNPNFAEAYYYRGLCRLKLDHSKGVQDLNKALVLQPTLFEAYLSRAAFYSTKKRYSKAILNCNEALRLRPRSVRALLCRGALKFLISAFHHAIKDLTQAIELDKQCALAYYNRAVCLHKTKKYNSALKDYSIVLTLTENDQKTTSESLRVQVFVNRALLYLHSELQDAQNAALDLEEATLLSPNNTCILHTMALCYHRLNDLQSASSAYTRCLEVDPYFLAAYVGRGDAFEDAGNFADAKAEYQRALKLDPSYVVARVHLGYNLQLCGRLQQAWAQFSKAIKLDPTCQSALEGRAITCLHAGDLFAASRDIAIALERGQPSARLLTACGVVHQTQRDLHTAMAYYNRARALDPFYTPAHFNAAVLYMRDRRFPDALECLETVIDRNPRDSAAILNRAITRVFLSDVEGALNDFKQAHSLDPTNAHIFYNRANLYCSLEDFKNAEKDFTAAFDINQSDYLSLKRRADVRGRLGNKKEAIEDYRQSLLIFEKHARLQRLRAN